MKKYRHLFILTLFAIIFSSCAPKAEPVPIETVFAATHAAIMAQTAAAMPKNAPSPTVTITLAPTFTPYPTSTTVIIAKKTATPTPEVTPTNITSGSGTVLYACNILGSSIPDGFEIKAKEKFNWTLRIENIGTTQWWPDTMYAHYVSGSKYHVKKEAALGDPTRVGESGIFTMKMQAPSEPGTYTTTWSLQKGIHQFCFFKLKIIVKK